MHLQSIKISTDIHEDLNQEKSSLFLCELVKHFMLTATSYEEKHFD